MRRRRKLPGWFLLAVISGAALVDCSSDREGRGRARGFVLISLSGLRADVLGFQGRRPSASPFLDSLAERALVYERAFTTSPDTLAAHVSMLSGLYPGEHRVVPPAGTLSTDVPVLPERFSDYGFRTGGFTGGGYLSFDFGFDRGFDEFEGGRRAAKSSFDRASKFLRNLGEDRFFLFVHSDALENALIAQFDLRRLVAGSGSLTSAAAGGIEQAYLAALARLDREIELFFSEIDALGLMDQTVIAVTADHGFEFGEHGRLGHAQVYPETLKVPLLLLGPGFEPAKIRTPTQTVDLAASFYSLAELPTPDLSGRTLPGLPGAEEPRRWAAAEMLGRWEQKTLLLDQEGSLYQVVASRLRGEHDGTWVTRSVTFDSSSEQIGFSIVSFRKRRTVRLLIDGRPHSELAVGPDWSEESLALSGGKRRRRLTLGADDCESPSEVGAGADRRCLSFKLRNQNLSRFELFDLDTDPSARVDISRKRPDLAERLLKELAGARWRLRPTPGATRARASVLAAITTRGEYPEPPHP